MDRPPVLDEDALRDAYQAYAGELFGFCLSRIGDRQAAQDAVQETFLKLWRAADRYDPQVAGLRTWLYAVARNVVTDHHRRRAAGIGPVGYIEDVGELEDVVDTPTRDGVEQQLDSIVVTAALRRLAPEHREVIAEIYLRDRPAAEVASRLGIPAGTVRSRLFHGLKALRAELDLIGGVR